MLTLFEAKLAKVKLPNETKYYMDEDELQSLRIKIRQINSMIVRLQTLEKSLTRIATTYLKTNV